jgi:hypothetical protein
MTGPANKRRASVRSACLTAERVDETKSVGEAVQLVKKPALDPLSARAIRYDVAEGQSVRALRDRVRRGRPAVCRLGNRIWPATHKRSSSANTAGRVTESAHSSRSTRRETAKTTGARGTGTTRFRMRVRWACVYGSPNPCRASQLAIIWRSRGAVRSSIT